MRWPLLSLPTSGRLSRRTSGAFRVLTEKDADAIGVLRHSAAHVLATAVRRLRPDAKIGFGPAIDDGFYYDFQVASPFTPDDLAAFEAEMRKVAQEKYPFVRAEVDLPEARERFADDPLKLERLDDFTDRAEIISTYTDGPFVDLCRGPHVPDTSYVKHFKLLNTAPLQAAELQQKLLDSDAGQNPMPAPKPAASTGDPP